MTSNEIGILMVIFIVTKNVLCTKLSDAIVVLNTLSVQKSWMPQKKANNQGYINGAIQGDALQLGGVFLISKKQGIAFQHLEEYAGDHVNIEELTAACKQLSSEKN